LSFDITGYEDSTALTHAVAADDEIMVAILLDVPSINVNMAGKQHYVAGRWPN